MLRVSAPSAPPNCGAEVDLPPLHRLCGRLRSLCAAAQRSELVDLVPDHSCMGRQRAQTCASGISTGAVAGLSAFSSRSHDGPPDQQDGHSRARASDLASLAAPTPATKLSMTVTVSMKRVMSHVWMGARVMRLPNRQIHCRSPSRSCQSAAEAPAWHLTELHEPRTATSTAVVAVMQSIGSC